MFYLGRKMITCGLSSLLHNAKAALQAVHWTLTCFVVLFKGLEAASDMHVGD